MEDALFPWFRNTRSERLSAVRGELVSTRVPGPPHPSGSNRTVHKAGAQRAAGVTKVWCAGHAPRRVQPSALTLLARAVRG